MPDRIQTAIVGGGITGLCCARVLHEAGVTVRILEKSDRVGGRVATDVVDFFKLDRGFQVFLTAYPEAARFVELDRLTLNRFEPGAIVWSGGSFSGVFDPRRRPEKILSTAFSPVATLTDKLHLLALTRDLMSVEPDELLSRPQRSTEDHLQQLGFSSTIIERFFRPLYSGIFLERGLSTSSRFFEFTFAMFAGGQTVLPTGGIAAIPQAVASKLPAECVSLGVAVEKLEGSAVHLADGSRLHAEQIVLATDAPSAATLIEQPLEQVGWNGTTCLYFVAENSPAKVPALMLNGSGQGMVNHVVVPTDIAPSYGPPKKSLISVNLVGADHPADDFLIPTIRSELRGWFGDQVDGWSHLRTYRIPHALPRVDPATLHSPDRVTRLSDRIVLTGDHRTTPSTNGAMRAGRIAAEMILKTLKR